MEKPSDLFRILPGHYIWTPVKLARTWLGQCIQQSCKVLLAQFKTSFADSSDSPEFAWNRTLLLSFIVLWILAKVQQWILERASAVCLNSVRLFIVKRFRNCLQRFIIFSFLESISSLQWLIKTFWSMRRRVSDESPAIDRSVQLL